MKIEPKLSRVSWFNDIVAESARSYDKYFINMPVIKDVGPGVVIAGSVCRANTLAIKFHELHSAGNITSRQQKTRSISLLCGSHSYFESSDHVRETKVVVLQPAKA
ncbi:unnamed protein product [Euphydryas editha]|uniref:Uncharacterized protein n=1 Tax=Euphydryas editha TaxID=104508 RepID=A0AAU9UNR3_EUPED|nr:unnamed protein product [Euphydryas editha]